MEVLYPFLICCENLMISTFESERASSGTLLDIKDTEFWKSGLGQCEGEYGVWLQILVAISTGLFSSSITLLGHTHVVVSDWLVFVVSHYINLWPGLMLELNGLVTIWVAVTKALLLYHRKYFCCILCWQQFTWNSVSKFKQFYLQRPGEVEVGSNRVTTIEGLNEWKGLTMIAHHQYHVYPTKQRLRRHMVATYKFLKNNIF